MELRVLQYFLAIAREESISGAAEYLHISQPTLSRQIKDLEEELGTVLFERGSRKITLTEDGLLLRKRAEEIMNLVDKTESEIITSQGTINGDIYIGCGETEGMSLIAKAIHKMREDHPDVTFHLHSGNAQDITERLEKGLIDFGVLVEPVDVSKYHYVRIPFNDTCGLLMRKDAPLASKDVIKAEDLKDIPLIVSAQNQEKSHPGWLDLKSDQFNVVASYNLLFNASLMVREGIGYALTIDKIINTDCTSDLTFVPVEPSVEVGLLFVWKKYQMFSKASEIFLKTVQETIESY